MLLTVTTFHFFIIPARSAAAALASNHGQVLDSKGSPLSSTAALAETHERLRRAFTEQVLVALRESAQLPGAVTQRNLGDCLAGRRVPKIAAHGVQLTENQQAFRAHTEVFFEDDSKRALRNAGAQGQVRDGAAAVSGL